MIKMWLSGIAAVAVAASVTGLAQNAPAANAQSQSAMANFVDAENQPVGTARLRQTPHGVMVTLELTNVPPGPHALHIHSVGRCEGPSFDSAGGHFEPGRKKHGFMNVAGPHTGDLPNIVVPDSRKLAAEFLLSGTKLTGASSLMDADGAAMMIHSGKDDYASDPAGNAGSRLACAPIVAERH